MCTKKTLYSAGNEKGISLRARERGGKLNFAQISYTTDCVREVADFMDMPMAKVVGVLRKNGSFPLIYKESRKAIKRPAKVLARTLITI